MVLPLIGAIGAGLSGIGSLGSGIGGLIGMGRESTQSKMERGAWERLRDPMAVAFKSTFYAPHLTGLGVPYGTGSDLEKYQWTPSPEMQNLYSHYLGRSYGLPETVARAQASQSLGPIGLPRLADTQSNTRQLSEALNSITPESIAGGALGARMPAIQRQLNLLKDASDIASFNLYRMQLLPQLIG